jgi:Na+/phosphate symporter
MVPSETSSMDADVIAEKVARARGVERALMFVGWIVLVIGVAGMAVTVALWIAGQIDLDQAVAMLLGTILGSVLSGATAYGSGVNVGLGAERLALALRAAAPASDSDGS